MYYTRDVNKYFERIQVKLTKSPPPIALLLICRNENVTGQKIDVNFSDNNKIIYCRFIGTVTTTDHIQRRSFESIALSTDHLVHGSEIKYRLRPMPMTTVITERAQSGTTPIHGSDPCRYVVFVCECYEWRLQDRGVVFIGVKVVCF